MTALSNPPCSPAAIAAEGLKPEEYDEIVQRLGRHPNRAELGMFGVMWSEHCCYKNSRPLLKQFPTEGDRILVGPGENAGVVDLGDGLRLAFKIESHNHPSAIEPFQGAATGVGGILRDIFTMGARPIAVLNSLRFGPLDEARNRRIFQGVVAGISHYGNCLVGSETLIWRDRAGIYFDTIGQFVESRLPQDQVTAEVNPDDKIEVLSMDPNTQAATWQPLRRLFRQQTTVLLQIKTALGRQVTVTPDHPTLVWAEDRWQTRPAHTLQVGDRLPILRSWPQSPPQQPESLQIDLLEVLTQDASTQPATYVALPDDWQIPDGVRQALLAQEPSAEKRYRYLHRAYLPLAHFLEIEALLGVKRSDLTLYRASGKANDMKAVVTVDCRFARFLGYYLAEGCVSENGNTYKIIVTFALHEGEYVEDVAAAFKDLGLKPCIERRQSTIAVYATSWLLGYLLKTVWRCGASAADKALPDIFFQWPPALRYETLKGLMRGDGSFSTKINGSHAKVTFATISHKLFEQTLTLLQERGIVPSIHQRPARTREIGGRSVDCQLLWLLEIQNLRDLRALGEIFGPERNAQLATALDKYQGDRDSFPRYQDLGGVALVKITDIQSLAVDSQPVYDIEVANTHLFITTSGLVTHNCVGVPTVGGEVYFDRAYSGNPLVNVMALGLMETPEIVKSGAAGVGNPVLYVGSTTGRDGMGGASFASAELTDASMDDRPAVQVGDPFLEKSLIEACLEAFKTGAVVAAQDMGAAGITCSTSEMAAKGGLGIDLDLDKIPVRETGMVPYEYLLSESQERMLFVAQAGREAELIEIFQRWGLHAVVAGTVIAEPIVRIRFQGGIAAEIPALALAENTPIYHRELLAEPPPYAQQAWQWHPSQLPPCDRQGITPPSQSVNRPRTWNEILLQLIASPTIASKRWIYRQYDHQVQNNTVMLPGGADAAVVRLRPQGQELQGVTTPTTKGVAATVDCNARYVYLNPYEGAKAVVAEAARNLSCVGAEPLAVTDNLNFGSPEKPIGYWQLAEACRGLAEACREFQTPVTGGNVSLYNETLDSDGTPQPIYPTPVVGMVGLIEDLQYLCGQGWQGEGDLIYLLGQRLDAPPSPQVTLGGSEYLAVIHDTVAGQPPIVDFERERRVQAVCRAGIRQGWVRSAHDCAEGGLAVALAEACITGQRGATIHLDIPDDDPPQRWDTLLFGEGGARILVSIAEEAQAAWEAYLTTHLAPDDWQWLGTVQSRAANANDAANDATQAQLRIELGGGSTLVAVSVTTLADAWEQAIPRQLGR